MALLTLTELNELARRGTGETEWFDLFGTGVHHEGEEPHTEADLRTIVANFRLNRGKLVPSMALGHDKPDGSPGTEQQFVEDSGAPAAGRVVDVRFAPDRPGVLQGRCGNVPRPVAEGIDNGFYHACSVELYDEPPPGCAGSGPMLRRVCMLGSDIPAVKKLRHNVKVSRFADRAARVRTIRTVKRPGRVFVFSEVAVDRKALEDQLKNIGMSDATVKALSEAITDDAAFQAAVMALLADKAGATAPADPAADPNADPAKFDDMPGTPSAAGEPSVEQMKARLVNERGYDRNYLNNCDEAQVKNLYRQAFGTPQAGGPQTYAEVRRLQAAVAKTQQELAGLRAATGQIKAASDRELKARQYAETVAHCDRWKLAGHVMPAEVDAAAKSPNVYLRLLAADRGTVRQYGEKRLTEYDAIVAEIEARGPGYVTKYFRERMGTGATGKPNTPEHQTYAEQGKAAAEALIAKRKARVA